MGPPSTHEPNDTSELLRRAGAGDAAATGELFGRYRDRLRRMVHLRMDRRLRRRLDPSDVLQEAFLECSRSIRDYAKDPSAPFFLWLRLITARKLMALHRRHLGAQERNAGREIALDYGAMPEATSASLAAQLLGRLTTPSQAAIRAELKIRLHEALNSMEPIDREVLALRHFEELTNAEAAQVLAISPSAASNRYVRALERLRRILVTVPGPLEK